ncbi:hypothetical protein [Serratia oryzae]|uniref:Uncharacterized protein n=1 Tax=Serratia oryzae TaxID=2034155 RepID=A0A1S8CJA7_9GAMM|nr:hypothetical protein [Serratia oryzae]OMQ22189.1 hypothetical protein BMI79_11755 [Serratia oryzae]
MPIVEDFPDLSHWRTVQEFSISQAALLLAGIDPYDYDNGLDDVKNNRHIRWKMAWGFSEGIVSAIRRGVLTPVQCFAIRWVENDNWNGYWENYEIKPTDRKHEISKDKTIITRDSLYLWVESERVDFVRKPAPEKITKVHPGWDVSSSSTVVNVMPESVNNNAPLLLKYEHQSEGLEFVQDAIKELWSTYDEDEPQTAPTKKEVIDYLTERGAGKNMAEAVNLVLRPVSLQSIGRRTNKSKG